MKLKDTTYDFLKWLAIYFIPSLETFVLTVGTALNWAQTNIVGIIIGACGVFIAGCIGYSVKAYNSEKTEKHDGVEEE